MKKFSDLSFYEMKARHHLIKLFNTAFIMRIIIMESLNGRTELLCASNVKALIINQTNVRKNKHALNAVVLGS